MANPAPGSQAAQDPPSRRRVFAFGVVTLGIGLLCAELLLQAFYYWTAGDFLFHRVLPAIYASDDVRCYKVRPDLETTHRTNEFSMDIYTNAQGFRTDAERHSPAYTKPPDVLRVLTLGPSFAFGWGSNYEDSYAALFAEHLRAGGRRVELINLGTPAQGPAPQLCWLREEGYKYQPDLVVQTTYDRVGGLASECPEQLKCPLLEDGRLYTRKPTLANRSIALAKNFGLVFYTWYAWQTLTPTPDGDDAGAGRELHGEEARSLDDSDPAAVVDLYRRHRSAVRKALRADVPVAYVFLPLSFVVHPEDASRWTHLKKLDPKGRRRRTRAAGNAIAAAGIPFFDATDPLTRAAEDERMYYWLDIHLTRQGNHVVAEAAAPMLDRLLEPSDPGLPATP